MDRRTESWKDGQSLFYRDPSGYCWGSKNTGIYFYQDFPNDTIELRKTLWEKVLEYCWQNKFACLNYRNIVKRDSENAR